MSHDERLAESTHALASAIRAEAERVASTAPALRAAPDRALDAIVKASSRLASATDPVGVRAREALVASTGLSAAMVDWCLDQSLSLATPSALDALRGRALAPWRPHAHATAVRLAVAVLAGNVFSAAYRAIALPLLVGAPVIAKAPSSDDTFARLFAEALADADPVVGEAVAVLTFRGGDEALEDALFAHAECVSVYGSDATIASVRARLSGTTTFVPHGHGLGLIVVPRGAVNSPGEAHAFARAAAVDVAAYDQRGCLSPHAVLVEHGGALDGRTLAQLLAVEGLAPLEVERPRGTMPPEAAVAQMQWRGVAGARGELFAAERYAVSYEDEGPMRLSPGYRNVAVYEYRGAGGLAERLRGLGVHLKSIGVPGAPAARAEVVRALGMATSTLAPRVCALGAMQAPPLDALADGEPPFLGLLRYVDGA